MAFSPEARAARNAAITTAGAERARERLAAYDRGLRGDELAAACGVAPGSVRQVLTRARRRLGLPDPREVARVLKVRCPTCATAPGSVCSYGVEHVAPHQARIDAANALA